MRIVVGAFRRPRVALADEVIIDHWHLTIGHDGQQLRLSRRPFLLISAIAVSPGIAGEEVATIVYADRADGGPLKAKSDASQAVCLTRAALAGIGLVIARWPGYPARFEMIALDEQVRVAA